MTSTPLPLCNNLVSAAIYNHIEQGNSLGFSKILFKRAVDMNDRSLRDITLTCNKKNIVIVMLLHQPQK